MHSSNLLYLSFKKYKQNYDKEKLGQTCGFSKEVYMVLFEG